MTDPERAAVHRMAGAFGRLAIAAELVYAAPADRRPEAVNALERQRATTIREFAAAMDELSRRPA